MININCSTCLELLTPSDDLSSTTCGHIFHTTCILTWMNTGKSICPQCRTKCPKNGLRRVFFTEGADLSMTQSDPSHLQGKIDSLTFSLRIAEKEKKEANEQREAFEAKNTALKAEFREIERSKQRLKDEMAGLKTRFKYLQSEKNQYLQAKQEADRLQEELTLYKNVEEMVKCSLGEVNDKLHEIGDFSKASRELSIIVTALKRELKALGEEKTQFKKESDQKSKQIHELKLRLKATSMDASHFEQECKSLKADNQHQESEIEVLKGRLEALQGAFDSPSENKKESALKRLMSEYPRPEGVPEIREEVTEEAKCDSDDDMFATPVKTKVKIASISQRSKCEENKDNDDGELKTKACGIVGLSSRGIKRSPCKDSTNTMSQFNILKKSRSNFSPLALKTLSRANSEQFYNGLGGHAARDDFPQRSSKGFNLKPIPGQGPSKSKKKPTVTKNVQKINKYFNFETP